MSLCALPSPHRLYNDGYMQGKLKFVYAERGKKEEYLSVFIEFSVYCIRL
jgi:hypothetical protein